MLKKLYGPLSAMSQLENSKRCVHGLLLAFDTVHQREAEGAARRTVGLASSRLKQKLAGDEESDEDV